MGRFEEFQDWSYAYMGSYRNVEQIESYISQYKHKFIGKPKVVYYK